MSCSVRKLSSMAGSGSRFFSFCQSRTFATHTTFDTRTHIQLYRIYYNVCNNKTNNMNKYPLINSLHAFNNLFLAYTHLFNPHSLIAHTHPFISFIVTHSFFAYIIHSSCMVNHSFHTCIYPFISPAYSPFIS